MAQKPRLCASTETSYTIETSSKTVKKCSPCDNIQQNQSSRRTNSSSPDSRPPCPIRNICDDPFIPLARMAGALTAGESKSNKTACGCSKCNSNKKDKHSKHKPIPIKICSETCSNSSIQSKNSAVSTISSNSSTKSHVSKCEICHPVQVRALTKVPVCMCSLKIPVKKPKEDGVPIAVEFVERKPRKIEVSRCCIGQSGSETETTQTSKATTKREKKIPITFMETNSERSRESSFSMDHISISSVGNSSVSVSSKNSSITNSSKCSSCASSKPTASRQSSGCSVSQTNTISQANSISQLNSITSSNTKLTGDKSWNTINISSLMNSKETPSTFALPERFFQAPYQNVVDSNSCYQNPEEKEVSAMIQVIKKLRSRRFDNTKESLGHDSDSDNKNVEISHEKVASQSNETELPENQKLSNYNNGSDETGRISPATVTQKSESKDEYKRQNNNLKNNYFGFKNYHEFLKASWNQTECEMKENLSKNSDAFCCQKVKPHKNCSCFCCQHGDIHSSRPSTSQDKGCQTSNARASENKSKISVSQQVNFDNGPIQGIMKSKIREKSVSIKPDHLYLNQTPSIRIDKSNISLRNLAKEDGITSKVLSSETVEIPVQLMKPVKHHHSKGSGKKRPRSNDHPHHHHSHHRNEPKPVSAAV